MSLNQIVYFYLICITECLLVLSCDHENSVVKEIDKRNSRKDRALLFPPSSTIGVSYVPNCSNHIITEQSHFHASKTIYFHI